MSKFGLIISKLIIAPLFTNFLKPLIMYIRKSFYILKTTSVILFVGLLVSSFFLYRMYDDNQKTKEVLTSEKEKIIIELKKSKRNLELAINENIVYKEDLLLEREKVSILLDEIGKANIDLATILKYKKEVRRLNHVVADLNKQNEDLVKSNLRYKTQRDSTILILGNAKRYRDSLIAMNENLHAKIIKNGAKISVIDLKVNGLSQNKNNETKVTDKARKTNKLRVDFTVIGNKIANTCMKKYYIQIIDAENNVVGDGKYKKFGSSVLYYSDVLEVQYQNKTVEVQRDLSDKNFAKGTYFANIFDNDELVSKTSFCLK